MDTHLLVIGEKGLTPFPIKKIALVIQLYEVLLLISVDLERYIIASDRDLKCLMAKVDPAKFRLIEEHVIVSRECENDCIKLMN